MIPNEGKQSVVGDVKGGELGRISFLFELLLGTLLSLALACFLLWLTLRSWFAALHQNYPPEWSICLPVDTVLPWWQVGRGKGTGRKE